MPDSQKEVAHHVYLTVRHLSPDPIARRAAVTVVGVATTSPSPYFRGRTVTSSTMQSSVASTHKRTAAAMESTWTYLEPS